MVLRTHNGWQLCPQQAERSLALELGQGGDFPGSLLGLLFERLDEALRRLVTLRSKTQQSSGGCCLIVLKLTKSGGRRRC